MSLEIVYDASDESGTGSDAPIIDVVAVHSLTEDSTKTWTHPFQRQTWLKEILPRYCGLFLRPRILLYGYHHGFPLFTGNDAANGITSLAQTLISTLQAERGLTNASRRPIIFICHGFGGILVKRALAFSAAQVSHKVAHNYSISISTLGIIFLGTPHDGYELKYLQHSTRAKSKSQDLGVIVASQREMIQSIADQFSPLIKQYHIFLIWEQLPSEFDHNSGYVVSQQSAAPSWDNTERSGLRSDHSHLCKFESERDEGFRLILEALQRYSRLAPALIAARWIKADQFLYTQRSLEASELVGYDVHKQNQPYIYTNTPKTPQGEFEGLRNHYFHVPHTVSEDYIGQGLVYFELHQKLLRSGSSQSPPRRRIFVIYGLGGSGKTQLCLKFVQENRDSFWAIFWIDASSIETAKQAFSHIGKVSGLGESQEAGKYWLAGLHKPWLLVIDNADDPNINYSDFFPNGDRGHILLTSRLRDCKVYATVGSHEFRDMNEDDAILLLLKVANKDLDSADSRKLARAIVRALGHLPLALVQAGASIRQGVCFLENYLEVYESHKLELLKRRIVQNSDIYHQSVYTTFDITVQRIQKEASRVSADAVEILQTLAFLHFQQVPASLFSRAYGNIQRRPDASPPKTIAMKLLEGLKTFTEATHTMSTATLKRLSSVRLRLPGIVNETCESWDDYRFREAIQTLENHSLIYKDLGEESTYSMHPLVQSWARERLSVSDQRIWSDVAANTLAASILQNPDAVDKARRTSEKAYRISLIPHMNANLKGKYACTILQGRNTAYQISKSIKFANVYSEGGYWKDAVRLQERIIDFQKSHLHRHRSELPEVMISLAHSYWNLFEVAKSAELLTASVQESQRVLGEFDPRALRATDRLAETLWLIGRREDARKLGEDAVDKLKKILGPSHPYALDAMDNLGRTYLHLGRTKEAQALHEKVLDVREQQLGSDHPDTLMAKANLGMCFHALRDFEQAAELVLEVFYERTRILGEEHAYTLWAINDLAKIRSDQGRPKEAELMLTGILDTVARTLGKEHIGMLMTKRNLVRAFTAQERWIDGQKLMVEIIDIQKRRMPTDHPDRIDAMTELARITKHLGRFEEAEMMFKEVIELSSKVHGPDDHRTIKAMGRLSSVYIAKGDFEVAAALDEEIRQLYDKPRYTDSEDDSS